MVLAAVTLYGHALEYASEELRGDKEVLMAAENQTTYALKNAAFKKATQHFLDDEVIINDRDIILAAVKNFGDALRYASKELRKDREIVLEAVSKPHSGDNLAYADEVLRGDRELVLIAVINGGSALQYASDDLKRDREVVLNAVTNNGSALQYASEDLRKDREVVLAAVQKDGLAFEFAS